MTRLDGRAVDQLRDIHIETNFVKFPEGSVLITCGLSLIHISEPTRP